MSKYRLYIREAIFTTIVLMVAYVLNLFMMQTFHTQTLVPMIFVLGVFIVSLKTQNSFWGIGASLVSVLAVNYAFTHPYFKIDLMNPECLVSAFVMLVVSSVTGALTTQSKAQQKVQAESEKERMRANLLRAVSHDLRTPLTSIYGAASVLIDNYDTLKKEQHLKHLREIKEDAEWLIRMVENLLSVTRIDGEKVQVVKRPTVLEELIDTVLIKFQKRYPDRMIEVFIPDEFISIPMDAMLIEQVLLNLLENAVFHAKGMTKIILKVEREFDQVRFSICDNGCGISNDRLRGLFTEYFNRDTTLTDGSRNNMGIGLSVCATIIKAHGSEIYVRNRKEGGAEFYFSLEMEHNYE